MIHMENFDDLENSSKEQLIEKVESLQDEVNNLREEKSKAKSNLMWKVRKLEKRENPKIGQERFQVKKSMKEFQSFQELKPEK